MEGSGTQDCICVAMVFYPVLADPQQAVAANGFFTRQEDEIRLYRIRDIRYSQTLGERMAGTGTLEIISNDASQPVIQLKHIKHAKKVKEVLSQYVEIARRENGVRTSEVLGGGPQLPGEHPDFPQGESLGPQIVPDVNGDGVDDRLQ